MFFFSSNGMYDIRFLLHAISRRLLGMLQSFLVWQLVFSVLFLRRRYSSNQILGCLLVTAGVILAVARYRHQLF